jgi:hypothetical protein
MLTALVAAALVLPGTAADGRVVVPVEPTRLVVAVAVADSPDLPSRSRCINCW